MPIRHTVADRPQLRAVTSRRLAAAKRALKREQDRYALFATEVMSEQETPEERIARFDDAALNAAQARRDLAAHHWRKGRRMLALAPRDARREILDRWNASSIPATAAYFADFIWRSLRGRGLLDSSQKSDEELKT